MNGSKSSKSKHPVNVWKIVSVVFISLFILVLVIGLFRINHNRGYPVAPTKEQVDSAKATVAGELQKSGDDINDYQVAVSNDIRRFGRMTPSRNIIEVSLQKNATTQIFLIDIDSGEVLMHSRTEFFEPLPGPGPMRGDMMGGFIR